MFHPADFFDLTDCEYADLFAGLETVWEALARLETYLLAHTPREPRVRGTVHSAAFLIGSHILIEEGAIVEPGACIEGPALIGRGAVVRHGAYVRANTLAARNSLIGHCSETKNAIFLPESKAAHFAYVGDSILGNRVNLGAGTRLANFRLGGGTVTLRIDGRRVPTGREKLGAILGDDCQLGCNCVCNPGTLLAPRCAVRPLTNVQGYYPARSQIKPARS